MTQRGRGRRVRRCPTCDGTGEIAVCPFSIGDYVTWQGQEAKKCEERVVEITEPQPGNYVLWTTLAGSAEPYWLFPINAKEVELLARTRKGAK
jgi:hypothetical protein